MDAGVRVLPTIMNAVILIAVLSVGNSAVYGCSRTLAGLAGAGQAPRLLAYVDRAGRPLAGIAVTSAFGLFAFVAASDKQTEIFSWLLALSGLSSIFTWGSICLAHILFRRAWKVQGHSLDELAFKSQSGLIGSYLGLSLNILVLIAQFWIAVWPLSGVKPSAYNFFITYLACPVVLSFFIVYKIWRRTSFVRSDEADLVSGRREIDVQALIDELVAERIELKTRSWWFRCYKFWC